MLTPGRRRRRERLVRPERHAPLAAVVAPYLLTVNIEVSSGFLAGDKTNGSPDLRENAFARVTNDAVSKAPAPIKKCRRSIMDALLRLHTHRRAGRPIFARAGHIVIHHRCRSRLVGGA